MDLEGIMLNEINQTKKDKYYMISLIYGIQKTTQMNETKSETDSQRTNQQLSMEKEGKGEVILGQGIKRYKLLGTKQVSYKDILE